MACDEVNATNLLFIIYFIYFALFTDLIKKITSHYRYIESSNILSKETNLDMSRYDVCDNIDLETVIMEYESYYFVRFQKYPKIIKKLSESGKHHVAT